MADEPKWKQWKTWERVLLVAAVIVAVVAIFDARKNKDEQVESQQKIVDAIAARDAAEQQRNAANDAKVFAEKQRTAAELNASKLQSENAKLQNVSIERLLSLYDDHLNAIARAASKYDEVSRLPANSDTIPQKNAAERDLYAEVAAFTQFVARWRTFADTLGKILDGNVQKMDDARDRHSPDDIEDALNILRKSFPDLRQMLEVQLGQIPSG
jgi:hypothetical protein